MNENTCRPTPVIAEQPDNAGRPCAEATVGAHVGATAAHRKTITDMHILLAEDTPSIQKLLRYMLQKSGAQVSTADNGREAVEAALSDDDDSGAFDAILMDMQMPILDGYAATRELRARGFTRPIIALTANATQEDRNKCLAAGCDDFATKPIDRSRLFAIIEHNCNRGVGRPPASSTAGSDEAACLPVATEHANFKYLDVDAALKRLDGDEEFFADMAKLFLQYEGELLSAITQAVEESDAHELRRNAHGLKGAVADFTSSAPFLTARALEDIGADGCLSQADTVMATLTVQVRELCDELTRYLAVVRGRHARTASETGVSLPERSES